MGVIAHPRPISECRRSLGEAGEGLSDEQVLYLRDLAITLANITWASYGAKRKAPQQALKVDCGLKKTA